MRETIGRVASEIERRFRKETDPARKLHDLVSVYFHTIGSDKNLALVTQIHLRQADQTLRRQIGEIIRPYYSLIDHVLNDGIEKGLFRKEIDPRIARRLVFGTMDETITAWVLTGAKYNLFSLIDPVVDLIKNGMNKPSVD